MQPKIEYLISRETTFIHNHYQLKFKLLFCYNIYQSIDKKNSKKYLLFWGMENPCKDVAV